MRYLGGKTRLTPFLVDVLTRAGRPRYVEPFVGGGSVLAAVAPRFGFGKAEAGDAHEDLSLLWNAVLAGWEPPELVTESEYARLRTADPSPLRGFAGFACSFGGKWFGGFARKSDGTPDQAGSRASLLRKAAAIRPVVNEVRCASFEAFTPGPDAVVYCDPPYVTSADYSTGRWRPYDFWDTARDWTDTGAIVVVSEFQAPRDFIQIAETQRTVAIERTSGTRGQAVERLFTHSSSVDLFLGVDTLW